MNKKLQFVLQNWIRANTQIKDGYYSSVKEYEQAAADIGVILPPDARLSYDYKYPNGMSASAYEWVVQSLVFASLYDSGKILGLKNLTDAERAELDKYMLQKKETYLHSMREEYEKIAQLNPVLRDINVEGDESGYLMILEGATYCFHPDDIKYFWDLRAVMGADRDAVRKKQVSAFAALGVTAPNNFVEPARMQKMLDSIHTQLIARQHNNNKGQDL